MFMDILKHENDKCLVEIMILHTYTVDGIQCHLLLETHKYVKYYYRLDSFTNKGQIKFLYIKKSLLGITTTFL